MSGHCKSVECGTERTETSYCFCGCSDCLAVKNAECLGLKHYDYVSAYPAADVTPAESLRMNTVYGKYGNATREQVPCASWFAFRVLMSLHRIQAVVHGSWPKVAR